MKDQVTKRDTGAVRIDQNPLLRVEALEDVTIMMTEMMIVEETKEEMNIVMIEEAKRDPNDEMTMTMITKEEVEQQIGTEIVVTEDQNLMKKKKIEMSLIREEKHQPEVAVVVLGGMKEKWLLVMKTLKLLRNGLQLVGNEMLE
jgi:hypothetical protein